MGVLLAIGAAMTLAGIGVLALRWSASSTLLPSASSIAVLPFHSASDDTALVRLGRDLAIAVSASLDGVGGITTTDRTRVARETAGRSVETPEQGAALAHRLGARSALQGTTIRDGDRVRLDFGLYDALDQKPLAQGITVIAHRDSLAALSDSVSWGVLRQVWRRGTPPTTSLAAVTTRSLPALRAFLEGERAVENDDWRAASLAYRSAIAADTTFALAYFGYWIARYWGGEEADLKFPDTSYRHRLPERERLLVDAWSINDNLALELERYREVTQRYRDYWPAWFLLGDRLHHVGILLGYDWKDAQSALNSAVALNPRLLPGWGHLFMNSLGKDTVESGRALAHIGNSGMDRLLQGIARSGGTIDPILDGLTDSIAREVAVDPDNLPFHRSVFVFKDSPQHRWISTIGCCELEPLRGPGHPTFELPPGLGRSAERGIRRSWPCARQWWSSRIRRQMVGRRP
jgi:TolB-like protein